MVEEARLSSPLNTYFRVAKFDIIVEHSQILSFLLYSHDLLQQRRNIYLI